MCSAPRDEHSGGKPSEPDEMTPAALLLEWLVARTEEAGAQWLRREVSGLEGGGTDRDLYRSVSLATRKLGKAPLALGAGDLAAAQGARPGWDPSAWTIDQAARIRLLLAASADAARFSRRLDQLCATADLDEAVAFYRGLPLYPDPPQHRLRAAEGVRSNMAVVFEAVAQCNPYPSEQFGDDAWNQMVLKALFIGSTLDRIVGLDNRANPALAQMLSDYAHERWAAGRPISPQLWRCVGPFARGAMLADLERLLDRGTPAERAAAVLALSAAPDAQARSLLDRHAALRDAVRARDIGWTTLPETL